MRIIFPSQESQLTWRYLLRKIPAMQCHITQCRQDIRSTTERDALVTLSIELIIRKVYAKTIYLPRMTCTDKIIRFPVGSKSNNKFLIILYAYDDHMTLAESTPDRKYTSLQQTFLKLCTQKTRKVTNIT